MSGNTLIAVIASHDSPEKNSELAKLFKELCGKGQGRDKLKDYHFLFTGGTFKRLFGESGLLSDSKTKTVRDFILQRATVLPNSKDGGVTILANLIVQRRCSIIWPFLSPITVHWLHPENLALMRLCDLWNAKRLMNAESVRAWFRYEAERDVKRNRQNIPLTITLATPDYDAIPNWPRAVKSKDKYFIINPKREHHDDDFRIDFGKQTIALIAHDAMKEQMVNFAIEYENELSKFKRILATGTTGQIIESACRQLLDLKKIRRCLSGPKGGDIEIATEILLGRCYIVVFFIDPLNPHAHIDDIRVVLGACMIENNDVRILTNEVQAREWIDEAVRRI